MYDIAIIGAGPGGYVAAIRASQLGAKVVLIEKDHPGGTCLNRGCIPSKSIIASADKFEELKKLSKFGIDAEIKGFDYSKIFERKNTIVEKMRKSLNQLLKSNYIDIIFGKAEIINKNSLKVISQDSQNTIEFKNLIIATGSKPASIKGLEPDHKFILDSDDILNLPELPESVLIVGSGAIGIEWARILSNLGKKVYVTEIAPNLSPLSDISVSERIERIFKRRRIEYFTSTTIESIQDKNVKLSNGKEITPDIIFIAAGRTPVIDDLGIENAGVETGAKFINTNSNLQTNIENIYAIGDITGHMQLAHVASHQGIAVVEYILHNKPVNIDYKTVPSIIYGNPEIASVGWTEQELQKIGIEYKTSIFPMSALGKSTVDDEIEGFIKVIANDSEILGAHIIGAEASSLIHIFATSIKSKIHPDNLKNLIFAHPAYAEAVHESMLGLDKMFIHLPREQSR